VPAAHGRAWQGAIAGAQLQTRAGAGHLAELEQPEAFAGVVRGFVG
jgi:pimeloyl-ACP methyl ester carboxylesterase